MKSVLRMFTVLLPVILLPCPNHAGRVSSLSQLPRVTLWAWQMPERLDFIDPQQVAVAYLDQTIYVHQRVMAEPRFQPMRVPEFTQVMAVVRIEMRPAASALSEENKGAIVAALLRSARKPEVVALQVDFDAVKSQRAFYGDLLVRLRQQMPPNMPLSITALASWCAHDDWIRDLPIDEAVPMMFRMGKEAAWSGWRPAETLIREPLCLESFGVSTDERWPEDLKGKRVYVFATRPWTDSGVSKVIEKVNQ